MKVSFVTSGKYLTCILFLIQFHAYSQPDLNGQLRTRTEYRHGQGTLPSKDADSAFFNSQRSRFGIDYNGNRFRCSRIVQYHRFMLKILPMPIIRQTGLML
jgi:hypothetical protein